MTNILLNIVYGLAGLAGLYFGAETLVKGASSIARKAGISQLVIGLTLVAAATSAPELVVSVFAAIDGNADISLGNIVGSNIVNIVLILGVCACITPLTVRRQLLRLDAPVMLGVTILLTGFYLYTRGLTRWQGVILLTGFLVYSGWNIYASKKEAKENPEPDENKPEKLLSIPVALLFTAVGLGMLVGAAKLFLWSAVFFSKMAHLSDAVIGLTVVAVGTSLPELATSLVAASKGEKDIAVGNVLGSNIFNILGILGITAVISPLSNASLNPVDMTVMLFSAAALLPIMRTGWKISRKEGIFFLLIYCAYTAYLILYHSK